MSEKRNVVIALIAPFVLLAAAGTVIYGIWPKAFASGEAMKQWIATYGGWLLFSIHCSILFLVYGLLRSEKGSWGEIGLTNRNLWRNIGVGFIFFLALGAMIAGYCAIVGCEALEIERAIFPIAGWFMAQLIGGGFIEETLWRGYCLTRLVKLKGRIFAILLTSFTFGLWHWEAGLGWVIMTFLMGIVLAAVALWRESIVPCITAHATLNALALALWLLPH